MSVSEQLAATYGSIGQQYSAQMRQSGVRLAEITNINDPDQLNRVKCRLITQDQDVKETEWCYVMAPFGGSQRGHFFFPNVGDLVVIAYLDGNVTRPLVIGSVWEADTKPPYSIQKGVNETYSIKTPQGSELKFFDKQGKETISLTTPKGTYVLLDDENQKLELSDKDQQNFVRMDLKGGNLDIQAKTKVTLTAGKTTVVLESSGKITETSNVSINQETGQIGQKAKSSVSIQGATVEVKASGTMNLQASAVANLKGGMVNIN